MSASRKARLMIDDDKFVDKLTTQRDARLLEPPKKADEQFIKSSGNL
jgi:hypothetical protein